MSLLTDVATFDFTAVGALIGADDYNMGAAFGSLRAADKSSVLTCSIRPAVGLYKSYVHVPDIPYAVYFDINSLTTQAAFTTLFPDYGEHAQRMFFEYQLNLHTGTGLAQELEIGCYWAAFSSDYDRSYKITIGIDTSNNVYYYFTAYDEEQPGYKVTSTLQYFDYGVLSGAPDVKFYVRIYLTGTNAIAFDFGGVDQKTQYPILTKIFEVKSATISPNINNIRFVKFNKSNGTYGPAITKYIWGCFRYSELSHKAGTLYETSNGDFEAIALATGADSPTIAFRVINLDHRDVSLNEDTLELYKVVVRVGSEDLPTTIYNLRNIGRRPIATIGGQHNKSEITLQCGKGDIYRFYSFWASQLYTRFYYRKKKQ